MAIEIELRREDLAAQLGVSVEEMESRLREILGRTESPETAAPAAPATTEPQVQDVVPQSRNKRYRYTIGNSRSGVCAICAPHAGRLTTGDGTDGVPVPPVHNNCVCTLTPVAFDVFGTDVQAGMQRRFDWMGGLSAPALRDVLGDAREMLLREKIVTLPDLYAAGQLVPLEMLDIDPGTGWLSVNQAVQITGISHAGIREFAKRGKIEGVWKIARGEYLIPVKWARANVPV